MKPMRWQEWGICWMRIFLDWNADGSPTENQNTLVSSGTGGVNDSLFEAVDIPDDAITIMGMDVTEQETGKSNKRVYQYTCKSDVGVFVNIKYTAEAQGGHLSGRRGYEIAGRGGVYQ